jgi:hypothetical protein
VLALLAVLSLSVMTGVITLGSGPIKGLALS